LIVQFYNASRNERNRFFTDPIPLGPFGLVNIPINRDLRDERYEIEIQQITRPNEDLRWVWGGSTRLDRVKSKTYFWRDRKLNYRLHRLFAHAEWSFRPNWILNAGAMLEYNDITGMDFSPRVSLNFKPSVNDMVRISYAQGIRTPALFEEYGDERYYYQDVLLEQGISAPGDIDSEKIRSIALSYLGHSSDKRISWELRLFQDLISDVIDNYRVLSEDVGPVDDDLITVENQGELSIRGLEASLTVNFNRKTRLLLNHTVADSEGSDFGDPLIERHNELTVPERTSSALLSHRISKRLDVSLGYYALSDIRWDGDGNDIDAFHRVDMRLSKSLQIGKSNGEISLTLQNLLDDYKEFKTTNNYDQHAMFALMLDF
jgi:iron complex outermembrane receptor protein